jgi:hypothetical protein
MRYGIVRTVCSVLTVLNLALTASRAESVKQEAARTKGRWVEEHLLGLKPKLPFSFVYDGQASARLLSDWTKTAATTRLDAVRIQHTLAVRPARVG